MVLILNLPHVKLWTSTFQMLIKWIVCFCFFLYKILKAPQLPIEMQKNRIHQYPQKKSKCNQRYAPHLPPAGPSLLDIEVSWAI